LRRNTQGARKHRCQTNQQPCGVEVEAAMLHYGSPVIF
jgi:hypothetical protein